MPSSRSRRACTRLIGWCRERRGNLAGAAEAYRGYLRNGGDPADPEIRKNILEAVAV